MIMRMWVACVVGVLQTLVIIGYVNIETWLAFLPLAILYILTMVRRRSASSRARVLSFSRVLSSRCPYARVPMHIINKL